MSPSPTRRFWEARASALAWRINLAAWLESAGPVAFFVASGFAVVFYALRRAQMPLSYGVWGFAGTLLLAAAVCWWRARRGFYSVAEARVLIESHLRLDTRLTAASLGLIDWPDPPARPMPVVQWQLRLTSGWLGGGLVLLALATLAPIPRGSSDKSPSGPPPALLQSTEMLAAIKDMNVVDPQALEQLSERAGELASRPAQEQYSHSALEAADALRNQIMVSAAGLGRSLDSASSALRSTAGSSDTKGAAGRLAAALAGMRGGAMPANKDLLASLPGSETDLKSLSAEQAAALAQQLAEAGACLGGISGAAGQGVSVAASGSVLKEGEGLGPGAGGEGGGGDHAPLTLSQGPSKAIDGKSEALSADSFKRASLGDMVGTSVGAHETDPNSAAGPVNAGAVASPASGGEAVWVNRLTPAERTVLKNFFK